MVQNDRKTTPLQLFILKQYGKNIKFSGVCGMPDAVESLTRGEGCYLSAAQEIRLIQDGPEMETRGITMA